MRGTGLARGHSHPGTSSGYKRSKSGNMKGTLDDVVLIDVDSDVSSNVVVIDVPQPPIKRKLRGANELRKQRKFPHHGVISIDDDESDVMDRPGIGDKGGGELDSDATSSKRSCPASKSMQNSEDLDGDECWVVHEKKSSFRLSKCKQTSSDKAACRQRYGLNHESESSSSESDCSDCEVMEGSFGKVHEQWEKASLKRKLDIHKGQTSLNDHTSIYGSHFDAHTISDGENGTEEHPEVPVCSGWSNEDDEKVTQSAFVASVDECMEDTAFSSGMGIPFANSDQRVHRMFVEDPPLSYEWWRAAPSNSGMGIPFANSDQRVNPMFTEDPPLSYEWWGPNNDNICSNGFCSGEQSSRRSPLSTDPEQCDQQSKCTRSNNQGEKHGDLDGSVLRNKEDEFPQVPSTADICDETHENLDRVEAIFEEKAKADSEELFFSKPQVIETAEAPETHDMNIPLLAQDVNVTPSSQKDIINEREKLKETDEYKRAIEAEWASRQRQLQIQAEEVQRLRKKRKAERRLLDMQRRQKQRVEEVRETQKKDEEKMNMKEQLRVEIRKELHILEMKCFDMASLLRGLGIQVGGCPYPLPHEVHAAYKRALLKFHPDRASKTDIRQQVEAEEKFKLISRMKEKFLANSYY